MALVHGELLKFTQIHFIGEHHGTQCSPQPTLLIISFASHVGVIDTHFGRLFEVFGCHMLHGVRTLSYMCLISWVTVGEYVQHH